MKKKSPHPAVRNAQWESCSATTAPPIASSPLAKAFRIALVRRVATRLHLIGWSLAVLSLLLLSNGCTKRTPPSKVAKGAGTHAAAPTPAEAYDYTPAPAEPETAAPSSEDYDEGAPTTAFRHRRRDRAEEPNERRRPGLATQWGEERDSPVHEVFFERHHPHSPASTVSVHYDDEAGVEAATGRAAKYAYPGVFPIRGGALTVSITDSSGDPLPLVRAQGQSYVIGDHGDRYEILIRNHTGGRFEIVASVDGLDVLDGQPGSLAKRGYLVQPWGTLTIEGFRDSYDSVRAFRFGDVDTSYAAERGIGRNIGVIGVAVFEERGFHWGYDDDELYRRQTARPFPSRFAPPP